MSVRLADGACVPELRHLQLPDADNERLVGGDDDDSPAGFVVFEVDTADRAGGWFGMTRC